MTPCRIGLDRRRFVSGSVASALLLLLPRSSRAGASEIYRPRHRPAGELAALARALLGDDGTVTVDGDSLILVGEPEKIRTAVSVLRERDVVRRTVVVRLETRSSRGLRDSGYRVRWSDDPDGLQTGRLREPRKTGRTLRTGRQEHTGFELRIRDGETGRIDVERTMPVLARRLFGDTYVARAGSELAATPQVLADGRVSLRLEWSRGQLEARGATRSSGGSTTIEVSAGEVVVVGGASEKLDSRSRRTAGPDRRAETDDQAILLRVEVE